jgi:sugar lactone lactonase YvrE
VIIDEGNQSVRYLDRQGAVSTLVKNLASLSWSRDIAADQAGHIFVAVSPPTGGGRVFRVDSASNAVTPFAGTGTASDVDGDLGSASFLSTFGLSFDPKDTLYVADGQARKIKKIHANGVATFAGTGAGSSQDGPGPSATFAYPLDVASDRRGNLYVADFFNYKIRKITPEGQVTTLAGAGTEGSADGPGATATFAAPVQLTVDADGFVYVAETVGIIRRVSPEGFVTTIAGKAGVRGTADGVGDAARFNVPSGIAVDEQGTVYVSDSANKTIRKLVADR